MTGIVGTIITIKELYSSNEAVIYYGSGVEKKELLKLNRSRRYVIPFFQRELRWEKEHLITLISDVSNKPKFLGNIILTKKDDLTYEILDGQQRTTIIYLLVQYLRYKYEDRFEIFDSCSLDIESFRGFSTLLKNSFALNNIEGSELADILKSDDYKQGGRYFSIWDAITECDYLDIPARAENFFRNLKDCTLNVIISTDTEENGIERFLDVNLKGVKLDTEDIFKGYLCAQNNSEKVHKKWSKLKEYDANINITQKNGKEMNRNIYPLMDIIEHYFCCKLLTCDEYQHIDFNAKFELTKQHDVEGMKYSQGTHLLAAIRNKRFLEECLNDLEKIMELIDNIVNSSGTSDLYAAKIREYNNANPGDKISSEEQDVMHNLTKKILLDRDKAPSLILIQYFMGTFINPEATKNDYRKIYAVSTSTLMFSLFEHKKNTQSIKRIMGRGDWYKNICNYSYQKMRADSVNDKYMRVVLNAKYIGDIDTDQYRCKTLVTIYDYYNFDQDNISVKKGKMDKLKVFLNDDQKITAEHFVINDKEKIETDTEEGLHIVYRYPSDIIKYKNALLNFIFISDNLNSDLGNRMVTEKADLLLNGEFKERFEKEESEFSKRVVGCISECFNMPNLSKVSSQEEASRLLDEYYRDNFNDDMIKYTKKVFEILENRE